ARRELSRSDTLRAVGFGAVATLLLASVHLSASFADGRQTSPDAIGSPRMHDSSDRRDVSAPAASDERPRTRRPEPGGAARRAGADIANRPSAPSRDPTSDSDVVGNAAGATRPSGDPPTGADTVDGPDTNRGRSADSRDDLHASP